MAEPTEHAEPADFLEVCPEFRTVPTPQIKAFLLAGQPQVDPNAFQALTRHAHIQATAHALAVSPLGRPLKLVNAKGSTGYRDEFERLCNLSTYRVAVL